MSETNKTHDDAAKKAAQEEAAQKAAEEAAAAKAAKKAKGSDSDKGPTPAWQDPDYNGPLDGEQAMWRNKHIKRLADGHATKPAKEVATK